MVFYIDCNNVVHRSYDIGIIYLGRRRHYYNGLQITIPISQLIR